jgi:alanine racemase
MNGSWVEVSESALVHNVRQFQKLLPKAQIMAVVKSDAYGHGLAETSKIFVSAGVDWLGVDSIDEALQLRRSGVKLPVLVLGHVSRRQVQQAIDHGIRFVSYDLKAVNKKFYGKPKIHIKVDTGMSRQGVMKEDIVGYVSRASKYAEVEGLLTHFANADDCEDRWHFNEQLSLFKNIINDLEKKGFNIPIKHAFNTPAALTHQKESFDILRLGVGLYGLWPSPEFKEKFKKVDLKPVLSWKTTVVQVKKIPKGSFVGYGITEKVNKDTSIAVLPVGYYDGFDRRNSSVGEVLVRGKISKVLGRISMNLTVVDVSDIPDAKAGDEVTLIGDKISAEDVAQRIGTISYEVICKINPIILRRYK